MNTGKVSVSPSTNTEEGSGPVNWSDARYAELLALVEEQQKSGASEGDSKVLEEVVKVADRVRLTRRK
jgi:hypothetical protein